MENQLAFTATDEVEDALACIGRTEDVTFSPDSRRLAIAAYAARKCLLLDVGIDFSEGRKSIVLSNVVDVASPDLKEPHGVAFLDSERLLVADRSGAMWLFAFPPSGTRRHGALSAERLDGQAFRESPGSVAAIPLGHERYDILVCNNYAHQVTRHRLQVGPRLRVTKSKVLIKRG